MQNNSIKRTLPRLAKLMTLMLIILILPANVLLQLHLQHQSQKKSSEEIFSQLEQLIESNAADLEQAKEDFSEKCIQSARMAAYFVQYYPSVTSSLEQSRELAEKLNVDEVHFFTKEGEIYAGTHPEYYGYTFYSGEQMMFFLPMLEDRSLELCQEITPNTAEGKEMQYAAVWMEDGSGIVQIGMEPRRLQQEIREKSLRNIISAFPMDWQGYLSVVDIEAGRIIASTAENLIGRDVSGETGTGKKSEGVTMLHYNFGGKKYCAYLKSYGGYLLIRTYLSEYSLRSSIESTIFVLLYMVLVAVAVISIIVWYVNEKLSNNLTYIVNDLKKIEKGNLDNITINTGIKEFDELIFYINQLLKSIRLNWYRLSNVLDRGQIPIGIYESDLFYKKEFINERLFEILGIGDQENLPQSEMAQIVKKKLEEAQMRCVKQSEQIFEYNRNDETKYLRIEKFMDEQSVTYCVTDMTLWWNELNVLREQSSQDSLTGLYNRRGFTDRMDELFLHPQDMDYAVMIMVDADGLKRVNDVYGHEAGDEYLIKIGKILETAAKANAVCARIGGDEFVLFLYGNDSRQRMKEAIVELESWRSEKFMEDDSGIAVSVEFSVGYAFYPMDGQDYHILMRIADENMYQEKRKRKKRLKALSVAECGKLAVQETVSGRDGGKPGREE